MKNDHENHFLDEDDIVDLMQLKKDNLKGANLDRVNMKEVEKKIRRDPFIKDAQLYSDLKGNLVVSAELRRPIARIVRNDGPDGYISEDGIDNASVRPVYFAGHSDQWVLCEADIGSRTN